MVRSLTLALALTLGAPASAGAFTVASGFTEPCHESISASAFRDFVLDLTLTGFVPPEGETWRELSDFLLSGFRFVDPDTLSDAHRFILLSLIIGVRSPDTDGHSLTDLSALRRLHADPRAEGQYAHALRAIEDDFAEGNDSAVAGTRRKIADEIAESQAFQGRPLVEQFVSAPVYLDFYGRFEVDVWGPAYHLGRAAHALQDSFAHTIRDEHSDYRQIVTVFNYVEAITTDHKESRDGVRHSDSTDTCANAPELFDAATQATIDLFLALRESSDGRDPEALTHMLDAWVTLKPDCNADNQFCDNERWIELAREEPTRPYVESFLGCTARPGGAPDGAAWWALGLAGLGLRRRRR